MVRALPDDGNRYELLAGELIVTPAPGAEHQAVLSALFERLAPYVRASLPGARLLWSPADIALGEDEVLQPDLFVCRTRDGRPPRRWEEITSLLLAVEVVSPSSARYDRTIKRRRYLRAGVPDYWIVDPDARRVECWRPGGTSAEIITGTLRWQPDGAAVPLELALGDVFDDALGS